MQINTNTVAKNQQDAKSIKSPNNDYLQNMSNHKREESEKSKPDPVNAYQPQKYKHSSSALKQMQQSQIASIQKLKQNQI